MTIQYKEIPLSGVELKMEGESRKFRGYASVLNSVDSYGDTILPGAYTKTLQALRNAEDVLRSQMGFADR